MIRYRLTLLIALGVASIAPTGHGQQETDFDDKSCGRQHAQIDGLIKGGYKARPGEFPWHVALFHRIGSSDQFEYQCGGTLVHKYLVVTAAHCVTQRASRKHKVLADVLVKVGRFNISEEREDQGRDHEVGKIVTHRSYKPLTYENDLAIIKLAVPAIFTPYVQPACLWKRDDSIPLPDWRRQSGTVVGWGLKDDNKIATTLNTAHMPVVDMHECLASDRAFFGHLLNARSFCAGHKNGTGVCNGDSGGGMFFTHENQWYLRGVVSYSNTLDSTGICNLKQYVGFTDAGQYLDWIYENAPINENSDPILGHPSIRLINQGNCGKNEQIFGYAEDRKPIIQQYPWMVQLRHPFASHDYVQCNGVLINKNYILTTATCYIDWNDDVLVTLGDYITGQVKDCAPRNGAEFCTSPVQTTSIAEYTQKGKLVLARLSSPAVIGRRQHIEAICLPTTPEQRDRLYTKYILTGWKESGNDSHYMQRAILDLIPEARCREEMAKYEYATEEQKNLNDTIICVRNLNNPNRSPQCEDYQPGTAIQAIEKKSNRYYLYGLQTDISYCVKPETFAAVTKYMEWILDNMKP
ncbi:transmembrane protease serine 9-like [Toxorhynchites rutilus septentrionalis]|uniref:transmembrane protease serine 9-like n=1 Tax=Toxorhynchites rutilus septentrionalis TaxID=329112 RepID=UPI002479B07C|nr:transmembrane protease serine 9-like [Toxorhynchites rutilus septentrionalis]